MNILKAIDPLIWFFVLGGVLFLAVGFRYSDDSVTESVAPKETLSMPNALQDQFVEKYTQSNGKAPSSATLQSFREHWLQEELLFREGVAMGLVENDPVIRRRIVEKVQILFADSRTDKSAEHEELVEYYNRHKNRYTRPETYSFSLYTVDPRQMPAGFAQSEYLKVVQSALKNGADPETIGLVRRQYESMTEAAMRVQLDENMVTLLNGLKQSTAADQWSIAETKDALALIYLDHYQSERHAEFEEVLQRVKIDFNNNQRRLAIENKVERLQKKYSIVWQDGL